MLPLQYPKTWLTLGWAMVLLSLWVCLVPTNTAVLVPLFELNDKFMHMFGYVVLMLWFSGIYPRDRYRWIALALFMMGIGIEVLQEWMSVGRSADVFDVVADTLGIAIGYIAAVRWLGGWVQRLEIFLVAQRS
jgi:VanZ family protein